MDVLLFILFVIGFLVVVGAPTFIREYNKARYPDRDR